MFQFGDRDWMYTPNIKEKLDIASKNDEFENLVIIKDCGHQVVFDNLEETKNKIFEFYSKFKE